MGKGIDQTKAYKFFAAEYKKYNPKGVDYQGIAYDFLKAEGWSVFAESLKQENRTAFQAFTAGLSLGARNSDKLEQLKEKYTATDRLAVPVKESTAGYLVELAALKGLTPGQLMGKILDKFILEYQEAGGYEDGSGTAKPGSVAEWYQDIEINKNIISWIRNDQGEDLTGDFLDYYDDPEEDTSEIFKTYEEENPGRTAAEAHALLNLFSAEVTAIGQTATRDGRKEPTMEHEQNNTPGSSNPI